MKALARIVFVCFFVLPLAACAAIFGFEDLVPADPIVNPPIDDSGLITTDGDANPGPDANDPCKQLGIPEAPAFLDGGGPDSMDPVHMAFKVFDFGITGATPSGLNLDRTCSPTVATSSCTLSESQATFEKYARDLDDKGTDNAGYGLLKYIGMLGDSFKPDNINERLQAGEFGYVLRLIEWNGLPDDAEVFVEIFPSVGVRDPNTGGPGAMPKLDSSDVWLRDARFRKLTLDGSELRSTKAFVTGGRLVAQFSEVTMPISVPGDSKKLDVIIEEPYLVGTLKADGAGYKLSDGVVAGRWQTNNILSQVGQVYVDDNRLNLHGVYICDPDPTAVAVFKAVKSETCDGRDLRGKSAEDNTGMPCNSVSAGARFDSYAVTNIGGFYDAGPVPLRCTDPDQAITDCDAAAP